MSLFHRRKSTNRSPDPDLAPAQARSARERRIASGYSQLARDADARTESIMERVRAYHEENDVRMKLHRTFGGS